MGYLLVFFVSMEVIRSWKSVSESFITDPVSAVQRLDEAVLKSNHAMLRAEGADMLVDSIIDNTNTEKSMEAIQKGIQDNIMKAAMKEVDDLGEATETQLSLVDTKLSNVLGDVDRIEGEKATKEEVNAEIQDVKDELDALKSMVEDESIFDHVMNQAFDASDLHEYQAIQDIESVYTKKSDSTELETTLNRLMNEVGRVENETRGLTDTVSSEIQSLVSEMNAFEDRNMVGSGESFLQSLRDVVSQASERIEEVENSLDDLRRCSREQDISSRLSDIDSRISASREQCLSSKQTCEAALGSESLHLRPGSRISLGSTGKSLVLEDNVLKVCDESGEMCRNLASI